MVKKERKYAIGYTFAGIAFSKADAARKVAVLEKKGYKTKVGKKNWDGAYLITAK